MTLAPPDVYSIRLRQMGCLVVDLPMDSIGTNPIRDVHLFCRFLKHLGTRRPDAFLAYTIKPVIYGGMACRMLGVPYVSTLTGLGAAFARTTAITRVIHQLYRTSQKSARAVIFQNPDDRAVFLERKLIANNGNYLVPGSGVDTSRFKPAPLPSSGDAPTFLMMCRLLWDKGVREFVEAAREVKRKSPQVRFQLLGATGTDAGSVSKAEVAAWQNEGTLEYLGLADDVRSHVAAADCIVLPSYYREGIPRSLLEATAMGRPIITTDSIGCREVVIDGLNGFLCRPRDALDLARAMFRFVNLPEAARSALGMAGRQRAEQEFDEKLVVSTYLEIIDHSARRTSPPR